VKLKPDAGRSRLGAGWDILAYGDFEGGCTTGEWCEGTDLDMNGEVNIGDFAVLADHWLLTSN